MHGKWSTVDFIYTCCPDRTEMFRVASSLRLFRGVRQRTAYSVSLSTTAVCRTEKGDNGDKKIYELRTYAIRPDKFGEYLKLMEENIGLRTAHSKLVGFWITELGAINEVNHLWEYGNGTLIFKSSIFPLPYSNNYKASPTHIH